MARIGMALVAVVLTGCGHSTAPPDHPPPLGSVTGTVLAAPGCPVERADSPCPALRVRGAEVTATMKGSVVARTQSAGDGSWTLSLPAGSYTLTATMTGGLRQSVSRPVLVPSQGVVTVTLSLDSGIR